jgi:6-phosphogluconolactonase
MITFDGAKGPVAVRCFDSAAEAGAWIAPNIAKSLRDAIAQRGKAVWLGCGGTTPKPIYERLVTEDIDWDKVRLFQVDERFVPTDDAASNTRMMREALNAVTGPGAMELISLIQDINDQYASAARAEVKLREMGGDEPPVFDFALMGMGPDAHYASIFPGHAINGVVYNTDALVLPVSASATEMEPKLPRITLTVPAINKSRRILFYITGQTKLDVLKSAALSTDPYTTPIGAFLAQCPVAVEFVWAP